MHGMVTYCLHHRWSETQGQLDEVVFHHSNCCIAGGFATERTLKETSFLCQTIDRCIQKKEERSAPITRYHLPLAPECLWCVANHTGMERLKIFRLPHSALLSSLAWYDLFWHYRLWILNTDCSALTLSWDIHECLRRWFLMIKSRHRNALNWTWNEQRLSDRLWGVSGQLLEQGLYTNAV
jgi:hypothetical protein